MSQSKSHRASSPLLVYLDTSDYSDLADLIAGRKSQVDPAALEFLLSRVDNGDIIIPYSMGIVSEALQYGGDLKDAAHRKAEIIERLSGGACFCSPATLIQTELGQCQNIGKTADNLTADRTKILRTNNNWQPDTKDDFYSWADKFVTDSLKRALKGAIGTIIKERNAKRLMRARVMSKEGRNLIETLADQASLPMSRADAITFVHCIVAGRKRAAEAEAIFTRSLSRPTNMTTWFYDGLGKSGIPKWMSGIGGDILDSIRSAQLSLDALPASTNSLILDHVRTRVESLGLELATSLARSALEGHPEMKADELLESPHFQSTPFVQFLSKIYPKYLIRHLGEPKQRRKLRPGDGGDLVHGLYIPYCDIWRSDKDFCELVRQANVTSSCLLVSKLNQLPQIIEQKLSDASR